MSSLLTLVSPSGMLDLALKSAFVMLLALVAAVLLGRASAAWRHLVWCLSMASLLLLPPLSLALPALSLPADSLPARSVTCLLCWAAEPTQFEETRATAQTQFPAQAKSAATHADRSEPFDAKSSLATVVPSSADAAATAARNSLPASDIETTGPSRGPFAWLAIGWAAVALVWLVPLAAGLRQLAALHRQSRVIDDQRWLALLRDLRRQLALRRSVQLRQSAAALVPLTWGAVRPVLLVPAEANAWTDERRRLVLLHELAHICRWDWLTQLLTHAVCAVYWFNPLVWLAARQMRIERERACDDMVLSSGARKSDYAQELLALAAGLSDSRLSTLVAVPMARRGALEDRLRGILDDCRNRAALTTATVCLASALAAVAIAPLAMLRAAPPTPPQSASEQSKQAKPAEQAKPANDPPLTDDLGGIATMNQPDEAPGDQPAEKPAEPPAAKTVTVSGKVVDDATGKPIPRLILQGGHFDLADPKTVTWGYWENRSSSRDGSFSTTVRWAEGWTARILADGYIPQPVLASAPPADKDEIEVTIRLKRGLTVRGVVLDHTGKPVKDAAVFAIGPTGLNLAAGQAMTRAGDPDNEAQGVRTDERGRFELPAGEAKSLAVSHAQFDAWPAAIPAKGEVTIRLPEPARVEVELAIDGADKESVIFYQLLSHYTPEFAGLQSTREVKMANPGKLAFAALPPGKYQLCRNVMNHLGEIGTEAMLDRQFFELKAGETKAIDYVRDKGARVRGKATWPAGTKLTGIAISVMSEKAEKSPFDEHEWTTKYASQTAAADGTFLTERIAPGRYLLVADGHTPLTPEQRNSTGLIGPSHRAQMVVDVPADGELTVPDLELKPNPAGE